MSSPPADRSGSGGLLTQTISPSMTASLAALFPAVLFAVTYLMAAANGHVAWCLPPVGSCTDITHTGLQPPESFVFRVGMVIVCGLLLAVWKLAGAWFVLHGDTPTDRKRGSRLAAFGLVGSAALLFSELMLQGTEETAWILHSLGASVYFLTAYVAQVLATIESDRLARRRPGLVTARSLSLKRWIVVAQTLILVTVIAGRLMGIREIGRPAQWIGSYLMLAYYLSFALDWRGRLEAGAWARRTDSPSGDI